LAIRARWAQILFELLQRDGEIVLGSAVLLEEPLGDAIHGHVCGLGGQHHGNEELEIAAESESDDGVGVRCGEPLDHRADAVPLRPNALAGLGDVAAH